MKISSKSTQFKIAWIGLICLSFSIFLGKANQNLIRGIDSNIHATVSMDVTSKGLIPKLPMAGFQMTAADPASNFNDHPFFFFWINGWIMRALGPSGWSARVLTATFSVGCVVLTFLLGEALESALFGLISALFLLFTRDIILTGGGVSLDPALLFFTLLSFLFWQRKQWIWVGVTTGVGLWFKTPVVLLVFPTAFLVSIFQNKSERSGEPSLFHEFKKIAGAALLALALGSLVWLATGFIGGWDLVRDYWVRQFWGTVVGGRNRPHQLNLLLPFQMIRNGFVPGLPFLLLGLIQIVRKKLWRKPIVKMSLSALGVLFLALMPVRFCLDYYYNPVFPFLAFLSSFSVHPLIKNRQEVFYTGFSRLVMPLLTLLLCSPITLGPEAFVALKRFMPLIQSYGTCEDRVLVVEGGEPVGSVLDYGLALKFYTGRNVITETCAGVSSILQQSHPQWVVISRENFSHCLSSSEKAFFQTQFQVGSQFLLSNQIPESTAIDLTPLERELQPVVDCHPQLYPQDRYHRY